MDIVKKYVDAFNAADEEVYKNEIDNDHALSWLEKEIPILECPDKEIERAYYFRFWTLRKHLKKVPEGWIFTEFLPKVPWSGMYNSINAAVGHHFYEARWLSGGAEYLRDYANFFLRTADRSHAYSAWLLDGMARAADITGNWDYGADVLEYMEKYYNEWEETHALPNGMFWSLDGRDAMEFSISGTPDNKTALPGIRPTLNAYMVADNRALAKFARRAGRKELAAKHEARAAELTEKINAELWEDGFYRAYHYAEGEDTSTVCERGRGKSPRELIGYVPWMFGIPTPGREEAFRYLADDSIFHTPYGPATADKSHPRFLYEVDHECLWNGYVWPFATAETLTALYMAIRQYPGAQKFRKMYTDLLHEYAASHTLTKEDGTVVSWIDEVRHPLQDEWSSRTILRDWGWKERKGGYERGKDYNHSTYCDLVLSGVIGITGEADESGAPMLCPNIPEEWEYCRLIGLHFRGNMYDIDYEKGKPITVTKR